MSALGENVHLNEDELEALITADDPEDVEKEDNFHSLQQKSPPIRIDGDDK